MATKKSGTAIFFTHLLIFGQYHKCVTFTVDLQEYFSSGDKYVLHLSCYIIE